MASTVQVHLLVTAILCVSRRCLASSDTISASSAVSGGWTVVSRGGSFELGFFRINASSSSSRNGSYYYVGVWYKKAVSPCTPVWIANRAAPVADRATSRLAIAADGNLVLINEADELVWSTNVSSAAAAGTVAVILDTGNLVLRRKNDVDEVVLWQSMDHPTDTWLPGARLGLNKVTGEAQVLTAWKNSGDPASGVFSLGIDPAGTSQYFIVWNRTVPYWASGEWNGDIFAGIPEMTSHYMYNFEFVSDANGSYFTYSLQDPAIISRFVVGVSGQITQLTWAPSADEWILIWTEPHRMCDVHAVCGAFAVCDEKSEPLCSCLAGRLGPSCNDYSYSDRCALWHGDLLNLQRQTDEDAGAGNLYLRLSAMDVPSKSSKKTIALACAGAAAALVVALFAMAFVLARMLRRRRSMRFAQALERGILVAFRYSDGKLPLDGRAAAAVAVKKLEGLRSDMGDKQFRNEVRTIGTINHVNLVRLRGFCSGRGGERLLVYDYMPNGSLDKALFGKSAAAAVLSWGARYQIAVGAARGLLYLHQGCRDCIIHCDIKPENILLDGALVAKVADFGLAKLVGRDFSRVLTTVRGTIRYLAPEWISGVPVTAKADVYSFGMVLLEIVSGRRNARCSSASGAGGACSEYFPLVAARKVRDREVAGLLDERLDGEADMEELDRVCRVACWCVQDEEANRPTMEQVVQALEGVIAVDVPPVPVSLKVFADDASYSFFSDECSQLKSSS
uniref:Receptor-like serine/threonine-protein kinase n=1 Tax=Oryza meridionalis TaxID=40149 RepID=A0A0E0E5F9_9ORYZ